MIQNKDGCNIDSDSGNWITMTRKSGEHLRTTYGNTGHLFRSYKISSVVYTMISATGDRTSDHRLQIEIHSLSSSWMIYMVLKRTFFMIQHIYLEPILQQIFIRVSHQTEFYTRSFFYCGDYGEREVMYGLKLMQSWS